MNYPLLFVAGFFNSLTLGVGNTLIVIAIILIILGAILKQRLPIYLSLLTLGVILVFHLSTKSNPFLFFGGSVQTAIVVSGNLIDRLVHNLGFITVPLITNLVVLKFLAKRANSKKQV